MSRPTLRDTPPPPDQIVARLGLIADTHMPDRLPALPETVFQIFAGVDLILHAGDVGELRVLDALSACAPVVAVHGNDESAEAQRTLPYQRLIPIGARRLLLTHAHYPDRAEELVARRDDAWAPKLARRAALGRQAGASIVIFGHTHIPLVLPWGELLLINPGALASGNYLTRQLRRSVALLSIDRTGGVFVAHHDLDQPELPFVPMVDLAAGFRAALATVSASIADAEVIAIWPQLRALFEPGLLSAAERQALRAVLHALALPRWAGSDPTLIGRAGLEQALRSGLPRALWTRVIAVLDTIGGRDG
jgi:uncharacterized protein